jgi:hypothetical protein
VESAGRVRFSACSGKKPAQRLMFVTSATVRRRSPGAMRPDELERRLQERLDALGPAPRAELRHLQLGGPIGRRQ